MSSWKKIKLFFTIGKKRTFKGAHQKGIGIIAFFMSIYQIWSVLYGKLDPLNLMAIHLSFILMLTFYSFTFSKNLKNHNVFGMIDFILVLLALSCGIYYIFHAERFMMRIVGVDPLTNLDMFFGFLFVLLSLEAARRTIGFSIVFIAVLFVSYALFGHLLDGIWYHHQMSLMEVLDQLAFSLNGLWGSPIAVSSSFVFIFVLFGAFLQQSGASDFFFDLSVSLAGRSRGGVAKISVLASAFMGTISGSPTANVVTTGAVTIPMAKRFGYSSRFAAAVEAVASTGGSFLPPIMGSSAFLMAAVTGLPYASIALAAFIPALLFYFSLLSIVHFEAIRLKLPRMKEEEIPKFTVIFKRGWYYFLPILLLVILLLKGHSPSRTGIYGIIALVITSWFQKETRMGIREISEALIKGAKSAIPISTACAVAGLVIAGIMTTGLGGKLNSIILQLTSGNLFFTLILTMVLCIILGMGMPVAAAYVLTAMLAAPTLVSMGVSTMAAHLFIVYFSIISAITPPVAVAAFAAAGIAKENPNLVGFEAVRLGFASFVLPFIFVFQPALLLEGSISTIIIFVIASMIFVILIGYLLVFVPPYLYNMLFKERTDTS